MVGQRISKFFDPQVKTIFQRVPSGNAVLQYSSTAEVLVLKYCTCRSSGAVSTCTTTYTFIIIMQYSMYHKRPLNAQNAQHIPMPEGGRRRRKPAGCRRAWGSRGHRASHRCTSGIAAARVSPVLINKDPCTHVPTGTKFSTYAVQLHLVLQNVQTLYT